MRIILPARMAHTSMKLEGLSYWRVKLQSGREYSEGDIALLPSAGYVMPRPGRIDWANDIVGSGDNARIQELWLCTPAADFMLEVDREHPAFQLHRGGVDLLTGTRTMLAQICGRIEDKATGACKAFIWDIVEQRIYTLETNVHDFAAWRPGVIPIGPLALKVQGIDL